MTETRKLMEFNCLNWVGNYLGKVVYGTIEEVMKYPIRLYINTRIDIIVMLFHD